ncbi:cysteine hydrolase family protein [Mycolicibacterium sp. ELW1]|uniref:cysteine hydrolase family protein n=1 Tax=Mycobacteriaceae TaxID=1762 RepID=UPI0011EF1B00|nr:isochorismatase family cysteine hydrolase [Mycobacterium sp. ELW1]QEN13584.1 cysteine hydrolase [Mycobacterium sp. ELW1]
MSNTALLVVDMLNAYQHPDADVLAGNVADIVQPLAELINEAKDRDDVELIYVNDNYGDFTAEPSDLVRNALDGARPDLVRPIAPHDGARIMTKVRHSAFYATPLEYLLTRLEVDKVVLTGQVTEQCILYSALDAYVRHYSVMVPKDAVAHIDTDLGQAALSMMERNMSAEIVSAAKCLP